jgi:hypothetical protein
MAKGRGPTYLSPNGKAPQGSPPGFREAPARMLKKYLPPPEQAISYFAVPDSVAVPVLIFVARRNYPSAEEFICESGFHREPMMKWLKGQLRVMMRGCRKRDANEAIEDLEVIMEASRHFGFDKERRYAAILTSEAHLRLSQVSEATRIAMGEIPKNELDRIFHSISEGHNQRLDIGDLPVVRELFGEL